MTPRNALTMGLVAGFWLAAAAVTRGDVPGTVEKTSGQVSGRVAIRWLPMEKSYMVTEGRVTYKIPLQDVRRVNVDKPPELDPAIAQIRKEPAPAALAALQKIVNDYTMMEWDLVAARWLAEGYLKAGQADQAIDMCNKIIRTNPNAAVQGELSGIYWDALIKANRMPELEGALTKAIEKGSREVAAVAQLKRGDIARDKGQLKEALVDGYLRTAALFKDVKAVQPEALFKATKCFEQLGQHSYAEKMRKRLLAEFPQHEYAQKLKEGA